MTFGPWEAWWEGYAWKGEGTSETPVVFPCSNAQSHVPSSGPDLPGVPWCPDSVCTWHLASGVEQVSLTWVMSVSSRYMFWHVPCDNTQQFKPGLVRERCYRFTEPGLGESLATLSCRIIWNNYQIWGVWDTPPPFQGHRSSLLSYVAQYRCMFCYNVRGERRKNGQLITGPLWYLGLFEADHVLPLSSVRMPSVTGALWVTLVHLGTEGKSSFCHTDVPCYWGRACGSSLWLAKEYLFS